MLIIQESEVDKAEQTKNRAAYYNSSEGDEEGGRQRVKEPQRERSGLARISKMARQRQKESEQQRQTPRTSLAGALFRRVPARRRVSASTIVCARVCESDLKKDEKSCAVHICECVCVCVAIEL